MSFSPTDSGIYGSLFSDPAIDHTFSDKQFVRYLLDVEISLATAQSELGVIPSAAGEVIHAAAEGIEPNFDKLQASTEKAGLPIIELVNQLRAAAGSEHGPYVHWGATTQDIMDTALVLQMRAALGVIEETLRAVCERLAGLADEHRGTLMAGRTHSQQALPITFGLKVAGWLAPLLRHQQRLAELKPRLLVVQFGGAAGTLASLGNAGLSVQAGLAQQLGLGSPVLPWHTQRDSLAEVASWLSLVTGSLAKMGQDLILMAQTEVGEIRESADLSRGGSSTMPQKSNPVISELLIAAARTNAGLLSNMHHALIQEHERATHSWQLEWLNFGQMFSLTAAALNKANFLSQNLVVNVEQMAKNVALSRGLMLGERINFALAEHMDRAEAKTLVKDAVQVVLAEDRHLVDVVAEMTNAPINWADIRDEAGYLGSTLSFVDAVVAQISKAH